MKYYQSWLNNSHPDNGSVCCPDGTTIGEPCLAPELQGNTRPKCSGFGAHYLLQRHLDTSETENSLGAPGNQMLSTHYLGFLEEMATMKEEMRRGSKLMDSGMVVMMVRRRMRPWWRGKVSEEMCWLISKGLEYIIYRIRVTNRLTASQRAEVPVPVPLPVGILIRPEVDSSLGYHGY